MTRQDFADALRRHDWYYAYSDDHRYWTRGRDQAAALRTSHTALECPFDMATLRKWAHNMIVDRFAEDSPDEWYPSPRKYKCTAPSRRADLMTHAEWTDVSQWMEEK